MSHKNLSKKMLASEKQTEIDFIGRKGVFKLHSFDQFVRSNGIQEVAQLTYPDGSNFPTQLLNGTLTSPSNRIKEALSICFQHGLFPHSKEIPNAFESVLISDHLSIKDKIELFDMLYEQNYSTEDGLEGFSLSALSLTLKDSLNEYYSANDRYLLAQYFISRGDVPTDPKITNPYGYLLVVELSREKAIHLAASIKERQGDNYLDNQSEFAGIDKHKRFYRLDDPLFNDKGRLAEGWDLSSIKGREKRVLPVLKEFEKYLKSPRRLVASLQALDQYFAERMDFKILNPDNIKTPKLGIPSYDTRQSTCIYPVPDPPKGAGPSKKEFQQLDEIQRLIVTALDERNIDLLIFSGFVQPEDATRALQVKKNGRGATFRENGLDSQSASHGVWIHSMFLLAAFLDPELSKVMRENDVTEAALIHALASIQNKRGSYWSAVIDSHIVTTESESERMPSPCSTPDILNSITMERRDLFPILGAMNTLVYCTSVQEVSRRSKQSCFKTVFALNLSREKFGCDHLYTVPHPQKKPAHRFPETHEQFPPYAGVYVVPPYITAEESLEADLGYSLRSQKPAKRPHSAEAKERKKKKTKEAKHKAPLRTKGRM